MRLRRLRCLTCYWYDGSFVIHGYPQPGPVEIHSAAAEVLAAFDTWTTPKEAAAALDHLDQRTVDDAVAALHQLGLLCEEASPEAARDEGLAGSWGPWAPEAAFFHYATRDTPFEAATPELRRELTRDGQPGLFTSYPRADRILLPRTRIPATAPFEQVLHQRRTHRAFTTEPVTLPTLATLLAHVFGPADFIDAEEYGALMRRTSAAGGARQELEAYLGIINVAGLEPGVYHYNVLEHSLELLTEGFTRPEARSLLPDQPAAGQVAFVVFVTAVLDRMRVKYRHPRAYRVSLLNAGHLGQTFALTATALGLGPYQSAAFHDTAVEDLLGIDGTTHVALYALAAGTPAAGSDEATAGLAAFRRTRTLND
ncbi:SagB/ThcOx family dehydrogenase [Kitasatospora sp. NBC_01266]|uniref:SagB/ThcOx family dehydrogenase n=1 Tax=Kitasatospora sp. NBC_01266 TaxID=2903572 RepID=UPI002E30DF07|nr:SagB/ThcOx family dehydrogenase [Kitasatospora sp. NBC_01266]